MDYKLVAILLLAGVVAVIQAVYHHPPHPDVYSYWSPWSRWARCNVPCGGGTQSRSRHCRTKTVPGGGHPSGCLHKPSPEIQRRECNTQCCPVDGGWSYWSHWSPVSRYPKKQERTRTCSRPYPSCGGRPCYGDSRQTRLYGHY